MSLSSWFPPKRPPHLERGRAAERLARRFLESQGYAIEAANVRYPIGELDLVAWDGPALCFIEVRSASSLDWGGAAGSITDQKRRRIIRAAEWFLAARGVLPEETRFDVVAIQWHEGGAPDLELIRGAFDAG